LKSKLNVEILKFTFSLGCTLEESCLNTIWLSLACGSLVQKYPGQVKVVHSIQVD